MPTKDSLHKIRVCFVFGFWHGRAGAELQLAMLLRHIDREKIEPFVLLLSGDEQSVPEPPDCPVYSLQMSGLKSFSVFSKAWELRRFFKQNKIDIIQALIIDNPQLIFVASIAKIPSEKIFCFFQNRPNCRTWVNTGILLPTIGKRALISAVIYRL